jgi:hypothetical protein
MECPSLEKTHRLEPSFTNAVHLPRSLELLDHNLQSDSMLLPQAEAGAADAVPPRMIYNPSFDSNIFLKHLVTLLTLHSAPFKLWNPYILSPPSSPLRAMDATDTKEKTSPTVSSNKIDNIEGHNHVGYERSTVVAGAGNLKRQLKPRHLAMISIGKFVAWSQFSLLNSLTGGVIGTGLFLGTASSLKNGGPAGLLLGYSVRLLF